jgi:tetratricopeptide (TPR) repeat protein
LSVVYVVKQQYDQAIAEGERAIALDPNNADSYAQHAEVLSFAGRPEEALRAVEQAMRLNPRYPPFYLLELGMACRATGRYTEAIAALKEASSRIPDDAYAHLNLAASYWWQWVSQQSPAGQTLEPAVAAVHRALALNDSLHWNHLVLGLISLYQQRYDQALAAIERGVAPAPTEAWSYAALAEVLSRVGGAEDALEAAAQALRLRSQLADNHLGSVGAAYAVAGRYEEAQAPLQRFLRRRSPSRSRGRCDGSPVTVRRLARIGRCSTSHDALARVRVHLLHTVLHRPQAANGARASRVPYRDVHDPDVARRQLNVVRDAVGTGERPST